MTIKLPESIKIGGFVYKFKVITSKEHMDSGCYGEFRPNSQEIRIAETESRTMALATILHELFHAINHTYSDFGPKLDERVVRVIENGFTATIIDNPHLLPFLDQLATMAREEK